MQFGPAKEERIRDEALSGESLPVRGRPTVKTAAGGIVVSITSKCNIKKTIENLKLIPGVQSASRLFPDETDAELSRIWVLDVNPSDAKQTLLRIGQTQNVKHAEFLPQRKPC